MAESERPEAELPAAPDQEPPRRGGGVGIALFALVVALAGVALSGYQFYERRSEDPLADLRQPLAALESADDAAARAREGQQSALTELRGELETVRDDLSQRVRDTRVELSQTIERLRGEAPVTTREWQLAEAEYLLRIGNHRVLMERDIPGALALFAAADEILADLDDFGLHGVREAIAEERDRLESVADLDVSGAFLRLETLKGHIDSLPLKLPEFVAEFRDQAAGAAAEGAEAEPSVWSMLARRFASFFEFRTHGGRRQLLSTEEAGYLELNLRLMLERAQLALLRDDATLYQVSLTGIGRWLDEYLDPASPAVERMRAELTDLAQVPVGQSLPDVSRSMLLLRSLREGTS